ncbi:MAG: hypothetical protein OCD02_05215 [Spirochaetaceae bacterium]
MRNLRIILYIYLLLSFSKIYSIDLSLDLTPSALFPIGSEFSDIYTTGIGISMNASIDLLDSISLGPEVGISFIPLVESDSYVQLTSVGINSSAFFYPVSVLSLRIGGAGGVYTATFDEESTSNFWWKGFLNAGYRLSPLLTMSLQGGYQSYLGDGSPIFSGASVGISVNFSLPTDGGVEKIGLTLDQYESVFPLFYSVYRDNEVGMLTITNNESAEIRNINVEYRAKNFTSSSSLCGTAPILHKKESIEIPLYANFIESIQSFTESGKIPGEVIISYEILGTKKTISKSLIIKVFNRNNIHWYDSGSLALFISPNSPEVLDYSKYAVGLARNNLIPGINKNMQFAMFLYEGLKVAGISYSFDETTPYTLYHQDNNLLDYIQYPFQTLSYKQGDLDDLGILYSSILESVGIKTAIIPLKNDFIVAYSLGITEKQASSLFNNTDSLLIINNEAWMPIAMSTLREGFINSWNSGINNINSSFDRDETVDFIPLSVAWETYPPSGIRGDEVSLKKPTEAAIKKEVSKEISRYISTEFGPKISLIKEQLKNKEDPKLYNRLGLLYTRAALYQEAKKQYTKAINKGSISARINLANIYIIEKNFIKSKELFEAVLNIDPKNSKALKGLQKVERELSF